MYCNLANFRKYWIMHAPWKCHWTVWEFQNSSFSMEHLVFMQENPEQQPLHHRTPHLVDYSIMQFNTSTNRIYDFVSKTKPLVWPIKSLRHARILDRLKKEIWNVSSKTWTCKEGHWTEVFVLCKLGYHRWHMHPHFLNHFQTFGDIEPVKDWPFQWSRSLALSYSSTIWKLPPLEALRFIQPKKAFQVVNLLASNSFTTFPVSQSLILRRFQHCFNLKQIIFRKLKNFIIV